MGTEFETAEDGVIFCNGIYFNSSILPEEARETIDCNGYETIVFQMTGAVTPTFDFTVKFSRFGRNVIMQWDGCEQTCNSSDFLFTAELVPTRYRPTLIPGDPLTWIKTIIDGPTFSDIESGSISFGPLGNLTIGGINGAPFTNGSKCGILASSITYIV